MEIGKLSVNLTVTENKATFDIACLIFMASQLLIMGACEEHKKLLVKKEDVLVD